MTTVEVHDLGALASAWRRFADESDTIMETALRDAFNTTGFFEDVWNRTPKSLWQRYAASYSGIEIRGVSKNGNVRMTKGWQEKLTKKQLDRVQQYGHENLARSILPAGVDYRSFKARRDSKSLTLTLSSSLAYARRMHETKKPAEGHYWNPGEKRGWSAKESGNKFLEKPFQDNNDKIADEFVYQVEREMHNRGLI